MDPEFPTSPFLDRIFAESPWTLALPFLAVAAALAWWGARNDRARPILVAAALTCAAAATLAVAAFRVSPGERAAETVGFLVAAAERGDLESLRACMAPDATMHYGGPQSPGDGIEGLMRAAESLRGRHRIESNSVTELSIATVDAGRGAVLLGCRTATASSFGAIPTRWWIEVARQPDGRWLIDRLAWISLAGQVPQRGTL